MAAQPRWPFGLNKALTVTMITRREPTPIVINNYSVLRVDYIAWLKSATLCFWISGRP
jgi:hypothetical protein